MTLRLAAVAAALAFHSTALAADGAATELARLFVPKQNWSAAVEQIAREVQGQLQSHPGKKLTYPANFAETARSEVEKALPYEETLAVHSRGFQSGFTEAELQGLVSFFKSPLGQKWLGASGELQHKVEVETDQRLRQKIPEIMTRLSQLATVEGGAAAPGPVPPGHPGAGEPSAPASATPAPTKK